MSEQEKKPSKIPRFSSARSLELGEQGDAITKKPRRLALLHSLHAAPYSFLEEAITNGACDSYFEKEKFGTRTEAYCRPAYEDIAQQIHAKWMESEKALKPVTLAIVRGSSGVGKSVFLAYMLAGFAQGDRGKTNVALFYAPLETKAGSGKVDNDRVRCAIWLDGEKQLDGLFKDVEKEISKFAPQLRLVVMDGCSMPISFAQAGFQGLIVLSASPSLYVKNTADSILNHYWFTMPPVSLAEALKMAEILEVDEQLVRTNYDHMNGIARYLFEKDFARRKVAEAIESVDATSISRMVSMQATSKYEEQVAVHSLVLWHIHDGNYGATPFFALVSRYAEQLVAKKLANETAANLRIARNQLRPLSGAEGYAGALFEAYAIQTLQLGGTYQVRSLEGNAVPESEFVLMPMETDPIEMEGNSFSTAPCDQCRVHDGKPRLLWPSTTNFPTFDCFYFQTDGTVYPMQITIAKDHPLKNSGAKKAKDFFDTMLGDRKPDKYTAIFVVPDDMKAVYKAQRFEGNINNKPADLSPYFEQWVLGLP